MIASLVGAMTFVASAQAMQTAQSSRWTLQADPGLCILERHSAEPQATLSIRTSPGSDDYRVVIIASTLKKSVSFAPATLTFAPSQKTLKGHANVVKLTNGTRAIWMEGVPPSLLDDLSGADTVTMATTSREPASVKVAGSTKAVEALRRCSADQLIEWGADARQFAPGGTIPVAVKHRDEWLSNSQLLAAKGRSARVDIDEVFRVTVSPGGVIDDCHALSDKIEKGLEKVVCDAVVGKPHFAAAKSADGQPVRGVATFRILLASRPY